MDKDLEMKIKDEQITKLKDIIAGTITETGSSECDMGGKYKWSINYSSILTRLIQEAGRWCEHYASDLFILWREVDRYIENCKTENCQFVFGFRDSGVDGDAWYENHKNEYNYYRVVWFLDVQTYSGRIKMTLHK